MEDRDVHRLLESFLDLEAFGSPDVFQVDAAKRRLDHLAKLDDLFHVLRVDFDVEDVDVGEALEENALAFHDRLAGERADVAEAEDTCTVGNNRDRIGFVRMLVDQLRCLVNGATWSCHSWRIPDGKVIKVTYRALRHHLHFATIERVQTHRLFGGSLCFHE